MLSKCCQKAVFFPLPIHNFSQNPVERGILRALARFVKRSYRAVYLGNINLQLSVHKLPDYIVRACQLCFHISRPLFDFLKRKISARTRGRVKILMTLYRRARVYPTTVLPFSRFPPERPPAAARSIRRTKAFSRFSPSPPHI